jgi:hypothetical protein
MCFDQRGTVHVTPLQRQHAPGVSLCMLYEPNVSHDAVQLLFIVNVT